MKTVNEVIDELMELHEIIGDEKVRKEIEKIVELFDEEGQGA